MVVRIRLARFGRKHRPFYRIVVADARSPRDGRHLERVGTYDPLPGKDGIKEVRLRADRIRYWMACGAQPTSKVAWLLGKAGILPEQPRPEPVAAPPAPAVGASEAAPPAPPAETADADAAPAAEAVAAVPPAPAVDAPAQTRAFSSRRRLAPVIGAVGAFRSDLVVRRIADDDLDPCD